MFKGTLTAACSISLALAVSACQKIETEEPKPPADRTLKAEKLKMLDAIPLEYGDLVGIVEAPNAGATLWFETPDRTITVVHIDHARGFITPRVLVVPRR